MPRNRRTERKQPVRRPQWRQENPRDELVSLIGAARGIAGNIADGTYKKRGLTAVKVQELDGLLEEVLQLSGMLHGEWPRS